MTYDRASNLFLHELGPQAQKMSKECGNERMAMLLQYVALGSMIVMTGIAASQVLERRIWITGGNGRGHGQSEVTMQSKKPPFWREPALRFFHPEPPAIPTILTTH